MGKLAMIFTSVLLFQIVVLMEVGSSAMASKANVYISNKIRGASIQVNCTEGEGDLAKHLASRTLAFGETFGWGFTPSVEGTTKCYCNFGWDGRNQKVEVWTDWERISQGRTIPRPCDHCLWRVKEEGFFRQPNDVDKAPVSVFVYGWF